MRSFLLGAHHPSPPGVFWVAHLPSRPCVFVGAAPPPPPPFRLDAGPLVQVPRWSSRRRTRLAWAPPSRPCLQPSRLVSALVRREGGRRDRSVHWGRLVNCCVRCGGAWATRALSLLYISGSPLARLPDAPVFLVACRSGYRRRRLRSRMPSALERQPVAPSAHPASEEEGRRFMASRYSRRRRCPHLTALAGGKYPAGTRGGVFNVARLGPRCHPFLEADTVGARLQTTR